MTAEPMTTADALAELGATPDLLTDEERRQLDEEGYLVMPGILSPEQIEAMGTRLDELLAAEGEQAGTELHQEAGTDRLANLVDKGDVFNICYTHPKFFAAMNYLMDGDMRLSCLASRFAKPGEGLQALHSDWGVVREPGKWEGANSVWMLDDYTAENGATRVVPGSHRWGTLPPAAEVGTPFVSGADPDDPDPSNPARPHPQQILVTQPAGTVVVFICHLWHSGTLNRTDRRRRGVYSFYCRKEHAQLVDPTVALSPETIARLTPAERVLVGV